MFLVRPILVACKACGVSNRCFQPSTHMNTLSREPTNKYTEYTAYLNPLSLVCDI